MARALKARDLYAVMQHAVGGGQHSQELSLQDLANDALEQVAAMHGWSFLGSGEAYIDTRGQVSFTGWNWTAATKLLAAPAGTPLSTYTWQPGDFVSITAGGAVGYYKVASKPAGDASLILETSIAAGNLAGTVAGVVEPRTLQLPVDFRELISVGFPGGNSVTARIVLASQQIVAMVARESPPPIGNFYACAERVVLDTGETRNLLRVSPQFQSNGQSALSVVYERRIPPIESDGDTVRVPEYCYVLVKQVARAWIRGLELPKTWGSYEEQLAVIAEGHTFMLAKDADDGLSEEIGRIRGGHVPESSAFGFDDFLGSNISIGGPVPG